MTTYQDEVLATYRAMSDEDLLELYQKNSLTEAALLIAAEELERRGFNIQEAAETLNKLQNNATKQDQTPVTPNVSRKWIFWLLLGLAYFGIRAITKNSRE
jgi:hypothetical protein